MKRKHENSQSENLDLKNNAVHYFNESEISDIRISLLEWYDQNKRTFYNVNLRIWAQILNKMYDEIRNQILGYNKR